MAHTAHPPYRRPGLVLKDHVVDVPVDHARPAAETIEVYAREVVAAERADTDLPWLLYLQGGPGGAALRPEGRTGWLGRALEEFRVLLLDQRGTGQSTPATRQTLPTRGDAQHQAEYLSHFRADSIVADAEILRRELLGERARWSVLGQSFGGFCALTYLSFAPHGLAEVLFTGGLPALDGGPDPVYQATYPLVAARTDEYFARYPEDEPRARLIVRHLQEEDERLPTGERLTPERFQTVGLTLGTAARFDNLHYVLEQPFVSTRDGQRLSDSFLGAVSGMVSLADRPLYAALHELCYCQQGASRWSARRIREGLPEFAASPEGPFRFTGEMMYPWQFEQDPALRPLRETAQLLAAEDDWPRLYDPDALAANEVPAAAAVYLDDMFVPYDLSRRTAAAVRGLRPWVTNAYQHDGIRQDGGAILDRLLALARGLV